jgi:hypothetical protein
MQRVVFLFMLWLVAGVPCAQAVSLQYAIGSSTTLLSTDLNALANNGYSVPSATYDNTIGQAGNGATLCRFELFVTFAANPTANTAVVVWLQRSYDGTNFESAPSSSIGAGASLQLSFPVNSGMTATRGVIDTPCPPGNFKASLKNDGTGQAFTASGHTLKVTPVTLQGN